MSTLRIILIIGVVAVGIFMFYRLSPGRSRLEIRGEENRFPIVSGANLDRAEMEFPRDFGGEYNLILVPFQRYQQETVNTWIPFAQKMERDYEEFMYYEFPTIRSMPAFSRTFINEGMRAGIPDPVSRERTITLYLDKESFKRDLGIETERDISLFLVDTSGRILWRESGEYNPKIAGELETLLADLSRDGAE